jgi:transposase
MRKGFNGLSGLVQEHFAHYQEQEKVYVFVNKRRDKIKLLHRTQKGFTLYYKRLEKGVFKLPEYDLEEAIIILSYTEMIMMVDGISIINLKKHHRY